MIDYILYLILLVAQFLGYYGTASVISLMMIHKAFAEVLLAELMFKFSVSVAATYAAGDAVAAGVTMVIEGVIVVGTAIWGAGAWAVDGVVTIGSLIWSAGAWIANIVLTVGGLIAGVGSFLWGIGAWIVSGVVTVGALLWGVIALVASAGAWAWESMAALVDGVMVAGAIVLAWAAWAWTWIEWGGPFVLYFILLAIAYRATVRLLPIIFYTIAVILLPFALVAVFLLTQTSIRGRWALHMLVAMTLTAFDWSPNWAPKPNHWKAFRGWEVSNE